MKKWLVFVLSFAALITLSACETETPELDVSLTRQSITINVSQTTPLSGFIQGELEGLTYHFTNPQVARVQGSNLEALTAGFSTLTVRTDTDQLVGRIEIVVPTPTTQDPGDEDPIEEPSVNSLRLALEASDEDVVTVEGIVTVILGQAFFLQNEDAGMYVFLGSTATLGAIQVGDAIQFDATRTTFNQRPQLTMPTNIESLTSSEDVVVLPQLRLADINRTLEGQVIQTPELFVKTIPSTLPSGSFSVVLSDGFSDLTMFVEATQTERAAIFSALSAVPAGHSIQLNQVAVSSFASNVQLALGSASEIATAPASEAFLSRAIGQSVTLPSTVDANLTLPNSVTVLGQSFSVSWVTSDGNLVSSTGTVTRPALSVGDQEVLLGGTFSGAGITVNRFFEVIVSARDTDDPIEPGTPGDAVTYLETFTGRFTESVTIYGTETEFVDDNGFDWFIRGRREMNGINAESIILGNSDDNNFIRVTATGGISRFSVDLVRAFTNSNARTVELFVNNSSLGTFSINTSSDDVQVFSIENINVSGNVVIELRSTSPGSRGAFIVDNFAWTTYDE